MSKQIISTSHIFSGGFLSIRADLFLYHLLFQINSHGRQQLFLWFTQLQNFYTKKYLTFSVTSINFRQFFFLYCSFDLILTGKKFFCNTLVLSQLCLNIFRLYGFDRRQFSQFSYTQVLHCSN